MNEQSATRTKESILGYSPSDLSLFSPSSFLHSFDFINFNNNPTVSSQSKKYKLTIPHPLYSKYGNALNPEFAYVVGEIITLFFGILLAFRLLKLLLKSRKQSVIKAPRPALQSFKIMLILAQVSFLVSLWFLTKLPVLFALISTTALALVVASIEFRVSPVPVAESLLFWITNSAYLFAVFVQDSVSKHKIFGPNGPSFILEVFLVVTSLSVFILEVGYYKPGFDDSSLPFMEKVNLFSYITFYYLQPLIDQIYKTNDVKFEDLPKVLGKLSCDETKPRVIKHWDVQRAKAKNKPSWVAKLWALIRRKKVENKPNLFAAIFGAFASEFYKNFVLNVIQTALVFAQPFVLRKFIQFFTAYFYNHEKPPIIIGYFWAATMFAISCTNFITFNQAFTLQFNIGAGIQSSLTTIIYEKALRLSPQSRKNKPTGDIINHITMDIDIIFWFCWSLGEFISAPLKLVVCLFSLYQLFRNATWAGVLTATIVTPLATYVNASMSKNYIQLMKDKDDRTSLITEILNSAKSIKFYSWEKPMLERLSHVRNDRELTNIKKIGVVSALAQFLWSCIPFFVSCATYAAYSYFYKVPLTPDIVFPALALFDLLSEPMLLIPNFIVDIIEVSTSLSRIGELLCLDELADDQNGHVKRDLNGKDNAEDSVIVKNATFIWNANTDDSSEYRDEESEIQETPTTNIALKDISFVAKKSKLTCIVGKVGSGKSSLIKAILGDIPIQIPAFSDESSAPSPSVETFGSIAYCPQNPWILNGTVKENILFGHKYDSEFYRKTIIACELVSDFKNLPDGDQTVVGEKGISLSGGQKARISLARAVYARADIYLLDDVLSAVDAHVGKNLIKQVLSDTGIIGDRTKVLATNSVPVLHEANDIYLLAGGAVIEHGNYSTVMKSKGALASLIKEYGRKKEDKDEGTSDEPVPEHTSSEELVNATPVDPKQALQTEDLVDEIVDYVGEENRGVVQQSVLRRASLVSYNHSYDKDEEEQDGVVRKTGHTEEETRKGTVPWDIFKQYIVACDYKYFSIYVIGTLLTLLITVGEKYLLSYWSGLNKEENKTVNPTFFLGLYAAFGVLSGLLTYLTALVIWGYCIVKGAAYFHNKMANSVLHSPMSFFDTTPVGRILNRFTEDIGKIDMHFPWMLIGFITTVLNGLVTFGVIFYSLPAMFFVIAGLLFVYNYFRVRFIPTARELKRIESVAKSPVLATIQESINGVETIKAFLQRDRFVHKSKKFVDDKALIGVVIQYCNRWLSMRLQFISSSIMFCTALLAVVSLGGKHPILPSVLGFVMTYSLTITYILNSVVRYWADMQSGGVAIERIIEYCDLPSEAPMIIEEKRPEKTWPAHGVVNFKKYSTAYRAHLDPVLREIELTIASKEKVGIVGRTGAGKSSLTLALFR
ncbi:BPT1, partial [Candida margitis]|uniref:BPT1 n=1 Tax=Candida margitis TaxID=1775924 RepID=UPI0022266BCD